MLSKFSVKKPFTVLVGIVIVIILGIISYMNTEVDLLPSMNLPYIVVVTINPGASPEEVEKEITVPVENELSTIANISSMTSTSAEHFSSVYLEFNFDADVDKAYADVDAALKFVKFPDDDLLQEPIIMKIDPTMLPIMQLSISREGYSIKDSNDYLTSIIEKINTIDGVGDISTSGLISNLAYININNDKIASSILNYFEDLLNYEIFLPVELKEELREGLAAEVKLEDITPQMMVDRAVEILSESEVWDTSENNAMKFAVDMMVISLKDPNSEIYKAAIDIADELISNKFILDENDESKEIFYDFCDQLSEEVIISFVNDQIGALSDYITPDILGQLLYAQDFEMPSGSINQGALSYVVKIGTTVNTKSDLIDLPVVSFDAGKELSARIDQLQAVLSLISIVSNGKMTFTEGDLQNLAANLYDIYGEEPAEGETGIGYATASTVAVWAELNLPYDTLIELPEDRQEIYTDYLMENAPAKWNKGLTANWRVEAVDLFIECFDVYLTDDEKDDLLLIRDSYEVTNISDELAYTYVEIARLAMPSTILYNLPYGWENTLKDIYVENVPVDWSMAGHSPTNDLAKQLLDIFAENMPEDWQASLPSDWEAQMAEAGDSSTIPSTADLLRTAIEQLDPQTQELFERLFRDRTQTEIEKYLKGSISILKLVSPEAVVIPSATGGVIDENAIYSIDFVILKESIEALDDKAIIPLTLRSIADITFLDDAAKQITTLLSRVNGELTAADAVSISINKETDMSTAEVTKEIVRLLEDIEAEEGGFQYTILSNDGDYIDFMLDNVISNIVYGALLAVAILFLFLRDIKATLVVGFSIVVSVISTFVMMYLAGITLNIVSMGGLALGVGMLVDNSVIVLENIYRLRAQGKTVFEASVQGAKQVISAIISTTLTTVVVFLPIAFIEGLTKQIFSDMALTVTFSILASFLIAITLIPMATSTLLTKPAKKETKIMLAVKKGYVKSLNFVLNHKIVPLILMVVFFSYSVYLALGMNVELLPDSDSGSLIIETEVDKVALDKYNSERADGEPYLTYDDVVQIAIDDIIEETNRYKEIDAVGISLTGGMNVAGYSFGAGTISANIMMVEEKERDFGSLELAGKLETALSDVTRNKGLYKVSASNNTLLNSIGILGTDQTIKLYGQDLDLMKNEAVKIRDLLTQKDDYGNIIFDSNGDRVFIEGIENVDIGDGDAIEEYRIRIDKEKANKYGLTVAQVFLQVQEALAEAGVSHTLNLIDDDGASDYDVYIYSSDYSVDSWYITTDSENNEIPVYILNNRADSGDTSKNNYFITNTYGKGVYIKVDSEIVYIADGGNIPLTKAGDIFSYVIAGEDALGSGILYSTVNLLLNDSSIYNEINRVEEFDLVTYGINSENIFDSEATTEIIPLYKLLDEECFLHNGEGEILYRDDGVLSTERIPLGIVSADGYDTIKHDDGRKLEKITIVFAEDSNTNDMSDKINNILANDYQQVDGVTLDSAEGNKYVNETFNSLYFVLAIAVVLIYLIMVAQFQSLKSPFIIMVTIPLAFIGSVLALYFSGLDISIMALMGLIILIGVVVDNGIVLIDFCNQLIQKNISKREALLRAGLDRMRPILMTAITTILGLVTMAFDTSESGAMLRPLAVSVIGGLTLSTALTLYIVPILFDIVNRKVKQSARVKAIANISIDDIADSEVDEQLDDIGKKIISSMLPQSVALNAEAGGNVETKEIKAVKDVTPMIARAKNNGMRYNKISRKHKIK